MLARITNNVIDEKNIVKHILIRRQHYKYKFGSNCIIGLKSTYCKYCKYKNIKKLENIKYDKSKLYLVAYY